MPKWIWCSSSCAARPTRMSDVRGWRCKSPFSCPCSSGSAGCALLCDLIYGASRSTMQEEYNARLLLSEGRIRFLEKRIAAMEDEQHGPSSKGGVPQRVAEGDSNFPARANPHAHQGFPDVARHRHESVHQPTASAFSSRGPASGNLDSEMETDNYTAGGGGRASSRDSLPKAHIDVPGRQASSFPGASSMAGGLPSSEGSEISGKYPLRVSTMMLVGRGGRREQREEGWEGRKVCVAGWGGGG